MIEISKRRISTAPFANSPSASKKLIPDFSPREIPSSGQFLILPGGIGAGILLSITVGYVQDLVAERPGAGSSLVSVSHFGGTMFASAVFAVAALFTDYQGTALLGGAIGIVAGLALFALDGARLRNITAVG